MPSFTASGQVSPPFVGLRGGFDIRVTIGGGTNSLYIQKLVDGVWGNYGAEITASVVRRMVPVTDYTLGGGPFRISCPTFDTGPVTWGCDGDVVGPEIGAQQTMAGSRKLESGDERLLEDGSYRLLEDA